MSFEPVECGETIAGRYRVTQRVASGAMGEVWEGVHIALGHRVALKVLRKESFDREEIVLRFAREALLLARIKNDYVVRVIDFIDASAHGPVIVMELVEGPTLAEVLHEEKLTLAQTVDIAIDMLRGLRAMHASRVVHRDIKPGNVVLRKTHDGTRRATLIDLGVARLMDGVTEGEEIDCSMLEEPFERDEITSDGRVVGTVEYMSPEQILRCHDVTPQCDVYAVGAVLYRIVAGMHPFGDTHGVDLVRMKVSTPVPPLDAGSDAIARRLEAIVARALAFAPNARYGSAAELLRDLEKLRVDMRAPVRKQRRVHRAKVLTRVVIAIAAVCAVGFAACNHGSTEAPQSAQSSSFL